ncbi:hypothetical protein SAMD00019534_089080 [Acytostelium subglobosum LB1]|uniref:hypothetical protein n=1 Tax=Acytostelium subglobosum LB1 TaxID=1410327 RepID=UPI000644B054|nr:hypothetical protein SAMD00019534_089080 [Acytostelium subglobosum LB1]GAM25733.1 hypothetical protein SAMD00019534_089080 [Acytostelium subglobosum LB1]|eukprot:XP_012751251.1 hypothetical protein SAMD00019534_089080 [Acytostelium subglobosum LB1]
MTIIKSITALSFNASSMTHGSISSGSMSSFGQSSNGTAGAVADLGKAIAPIIDTVTGTVNGLLATTFKTVDSVTSGLGI